MRSGVKRRISVCLQESQHLGVLPGGRGSGRAAHVLALQRQSHQHVGQRAGPSSRRKSGHAPPSGFTPPRRSKVVKEETSIVRSLPSHPR